MGEKSECESAVEGVRGVRQRKEASKYFQGENEVMTKYPPRVHRVGGCGEKKVCWH